MRLPGQAVQTLLERRLPSKAGGRAAAMCTLIGTVRVTGVDPEAWLRHVRTHIAAHPGNQVENCNVPAAAMTPLPNGVTQPSANLPQHSNTALS